MTSFGAPAAASRVFFRFFFGGPFALTRFLRVIFAVVLLPDAFGALGIVG